VRQSRLMSFVEAVTNVVVGYLLAVATQFAIFPMFGLVVSIGDNLLIASFFTVVSLVRSFVLRRLFEALLIDKSATGASPGILLHSPKPDRQAPQAAR
jgi:hypothetical protein